VKQIGPDPEVLIKIIVPQEFVGATVGRLNECDGVVTSMELQEPNMLIRGSLPGSQLDLLAEDISSFTLGRGKAERDDT